MIKTYRLRNLLLGGQLTGESLEALLGDKEYLGACYELVSNARMLQDVCGSPLAVEAFANSPLAVEAFASSPLAVEAFASSPLAVEAFTDPPRALLRGTLASETALENSVIRDKFLDNYTPLDWSFSSAPQFGDIRYSPELDLYVGVSGGTQNWGTTAGYSQDGKTWKTTTTGGYQAVCWSPEKKLFCAVGRQVSGTSANGKAWTNHTTSLTLYSVCWDAVANCFVGVGEKAIATSTDGISWVTRLAPSAILSYVCSDGKGRFVAVTDKAFYWSAGGTSWNPVSVPSPAVVWRTVAWDEAHSRFAALGNDSKAAGYVAKSSTGASWSVSSAPFNHSETQIIYVPRLRCLVAAGRDFYSTTGTVAISGDGGVTWRDFAGIPTDRRYQTRLCWNSKHQQLLVCERYISDWITGRMYLSENWGL